MEAVIKNGAIILPKKLMREIKLPRNGKCEVIVDEKEIKITRDNFTPYDIINDIKNSAVTCSIDKMPQDELIEDI